MVREESSRTTTRVGALKALTASRQSILDRLRSRPIAAPPLPELDQAQVTKFDDPVSKFTEMLEAVGGRLHLVSSAAQVQEILDTLPEFAGAKRIASFVPDAVVGNFDACSVDDPHLLESVDWVIAPGEFMVAENGAIWIDGQRLPHRVLLFIAQYQAIVVPRNQIVHNLHEAYRRIGDPKPGFGVFVSGPSKTADIEQSLVLGAHGCRSLQVFLTSSD